MQELAQLSLAEAVEHIGRTMLLFDSRSGRTVLAYVRQRRTFSRGVVLCFSDGSEWALTNRYSERYRVVPEKMLGVEYD